MKQHLVLEINFYLLTISKEDALLLQILQIIYLALKNTHSSDAKS